MKEGLKIENLFDQEWYKAQLDKKGIVYPEGDLFTHYQKEGKFNLSLSPSPFFDAEYYLAWYPDAKEYVDRHKGSAIDHFITQGQYQTPEYATSVFFDPKYYLNKFPDVVKEAHDAKRKGPIALNHFISINTGPGNREERDPSDYFSFKNYVSTIGSEKADTLREQKISLFIRFARELELVEDEFSSWLSLYRLVKLLDGDKAHLKFWIKRYQKNIISAEGRAELLKTIPALSGGILEGLEKLVQNNIDSATAISCITYDAFSSLAKKAGIPEKTVSLMYNNAKKTAASAAQIYINKKQENSPYLKNLSFIQKNAVVNDKTSSGSYQDLFGQLDYFADTTNSVHSPAAYFYELMQITNDEKYFKLRRDKGNNFEQWQLKVRRPDLYKMPLNTDSALTLVPHAKIANYILSCFYLNSLGKMPKDGFANTQSFLTRQEEAMRQALAVNWDEKPEKSQAPYVLPLEQIEAYLSVFQTNVFEAYCLFRSQNTTNNFLTGEKIFSSERETQATYDFATVLAYLNLSFLEYNWLKNLLIPDPRVLNDKSCMEMREFSHQTGISHEQIRQVLF